MQQIALKDLLGRLVKLVRRLAVKDRAREPEEKIEVGSRVVIKLNYQAVDQEYLKNSEE